MRSQPILLGTFAFPYSLAIPSFELAICLDINLIDVTADIIANIPDELALHLLSFLDLPDIVACLRVSRFVL